MNTIEKLVSIFTPEFVQENADLNSIDAIYEKVSMVAPEITKEEMEDFLVKVSEQMNQGELSVEDLDNVAGGIGLLAVAAGIGTVAGVFTAGYAVGCIIGKFVRNLRG